MSHLLISLSSNKTYYGFSNCRKKTLVVSVIRNQLSTTKICDKLTTVLKSIMFNYSNTRRELFLVGLTRVHSIGSELVEPQVETGNEMKCFSVQKKLLCDRIPYFQKMFSWEELSLGRTSHEWLKTQLRFSMF